MLVWSSTYDTTEQIYFSGLNDSQQWTIPQQISNCPGFAFQPSAAQGTGGMLWAIWVCQDKAGNYLQYSTNTSTSWAPPRNIEFAMQSFRSPVIIVDKDDTPLIAWSGTETTYPDIFWSKKENRGWKPPRKAHPDNDVPELYPAMSRDADGKIFLTWQTLLENKYRDIATEWSGLDWQKIDPQEAVHHDRILTPDQLQAIVSSIEFDADLRKASLIVQGKGGTVTFHLAQFHVK